MSSSTDDDDELGTGGALVLATIAFLLMKGLIDAHDARDRKRVKKVWKRFKDAETKGPQSDATLFGRITRDPFAPW